MTKFRLSQTKESAENNFRLDETGRKFSKWVRDTTEVGEIAHYEQFLLFQLCFQKTCTAKMKNQGLSGKGLRTKSFCYVYGTKGIPYVRQ